MSCGAADAAHAAVTAHAAVGTVFCIDCVQQFRISVAAVAAGSSVSAKIDDDIIGFDISSDWVVLQTAQI